MKTTTQRKNYFIAMLIGALAIPLLALAANGLIEGNGSEDQTEASVTAAPLLFLSEPIEKVIDAAAPDEDHVAAACGPDGQVLIERELDGSIDPIEQAALDALRPICDEAGLAIPDAPTPAPVVQQVVVVEQITPASVSAPSSDDSAGHEKEDDGEREDHEDEEDEEDEEDDH